MAQHTPGPWRLRNSGQALIIEGAEEPCPIQGRARGPVCTTGWFPLCAGSKRLRRGGPTERQAADAALITAAPDLLAALKAVQEHIWADCRIPGEVRRDWEAVYHNTVCRAVAKAEGR